MSDEDAEVRLMWSVARWVIVLVVGGILGGMWGCPQYAIYSRRAAGQAQLAEAQSNRQIAVAEAAAKQESAVHLAQAEVERAKGVAEANRIIGASLKSNHEYLTWLWIESLHQGSNSVIYVPTEAQMPILEASRFNFLRDTTRR